MTMKTEYRACVTIGALIAASLTVSGCLGPTYGTDKTSTAQLLDDLGNIASIGKTNKGSGIEYKPRPAIVKPANTASLPAPQQNVAENNPAWVESPEETRKRLIAEADSAGPNYNSPWPSGWRHPAQPEVRSAAAPQMVRRHRRKRSAWQNSASLSRKHGRSSKAPIQTAAASCPIRR
ncbi:hypothetical protein [Hoeflea ulvae]|uniref:Lipoprotein n=1 Tax=Hoeflea ulvae TaxID=2983764 RepID=A0ABT3YDI5_9HYPH|nr:hypothetical protein [Hoeflea ulvae]MCY0093918.1 hypothetical protein [Hoeflea ulvae]